MQRRGYTGHENVEGLGIIQMNGRIYDPLLARFVQADPTLQFTQLSQWYNRYSYVLNNPMTYTDPSGYFVKWVMKKTGTWNILRAIGQIPGVDIIASMFIAAICAPSGAVAQCYATSMAVFQGFKTYAVAGSLKAGGLAGALSYATAHVSKAIGGKYQFAKGGMNSVLNVFSHSMVGGVSSVVQGGKFGHGFLSSMVSTSLKGFMDPSTTDLVESPYTRTLIAGLVGGTVSSITGGKFANGALTSSIQWWMNAEKAGGTKGSSEKKIFVIKKGDKTLIKNISTKLDNIIAGLDNNTGKVKDLLINEFGFGTNVLTVDADESLNSAGNMDANKNGLITINPSGQGSVGEGLLVLGHEAVHYRDCTLNNANWSQYDTQTELNAFAWEQANYKTFLPESLHKWYFDDLNKNIRSVNNGTYGH